MTVSIGVKRDFLFSSVSDCFYFWNQFHQYFYGEAALTPTWAKADLINSSE